MGLGFQGLGFRVQGLRRYGSSRIVEPCLQVEVGFTFGSLTPAILCAAPVLLVVGVPGEPSRPRIQKLPLTGLLSYCHWFSLLFT